MPPEERTLIAQSKSAGHVTEPAWRVATETLAMIGGVLFWAVFGLSFTIAGTVLHLLLPRRCGRRLGRHSLLWAFRVFVRYLDITGLVHADLRDLERLRAPSGPRIIAPNHTSLWDAVFLISRIPDCICIMKQSIQQNPFLGGGARLAGFIPNTGPSSMVRRATAALAEGGNLLLFPEGTRTRRSSPWINPLKGGCALIAAHAAVPVQPVFIRSDSRYLEKGWPLYRRPKFPIRIHVSLGDPLTPTPGESVHDFTHRLQDLFEHELSRPHPLRRSGTEPATPHQAV